MPAAPTTPLQYNGMSWPEFCFEGSEPEHLFIIGDWGGVEMGGHASPAPNINPKANRFFKAGIDDRAQQLVAQQMMNLAAKVKPRLVLSGGDNFYWGGVRGVCGKPMDAAIRDFHNPGTGESIQFAAVFERMYAGALSDVPWLVCFGNHDYGGYQFNTAWDQQIAYTWGPTKRWILPAQYYHQHISYPSKDFSIDVYMIDTNNQDTTDPNEDAGHNICSAKHNVGANCAPFGPTDPENCVQWFRQLWEAQVKWMEEKICASTADWQIVVTHFPPEPFAHSGSAPGDWARIGNQCGIDFFVGSHRHDQEIHPGGAIGCPYLVAGGGGGITSESDPGDNTQYGFFDMIVTKDHLYVESINQDGQVKEKITVQKRAAAASTAPGHSGWHWR